MLIIRPAIYLVALCAISLSSNAALAASHEKLEICELALERNFDISMLPLCLYSKQSSGDAATVFKTFYYSLGAEKEVKNLDKLLQNLRPRLVDRDYYYLLGLIEIKKNKDRARVYFQKASALGNKDASEYLYQFMGGGFIYIDLAYRQGSSTAKFAYALRLKSGSDGLVKDENKAAQLIYESTLEGDGAAYAAIMQYQKWLSKDQVDFLNSTRYLQLGKEISSQVEYPKVNNWTAYCALLMKAEGLYRSMPSPYDMNSKQRDHLADVVLRCAKN